MSTKPTARPMLDAAILRAAALDAMRKLDLRQQVKNPVMFVVAVGALLTSGIVVRDVVIGTTTNLGFNLQIALWLWFTVLFANFAEAMAEGRGKAQAASLRKMRTQSTARRVISSDGAAREERISASQTRSSGSRISFRLLL